MNRTVASQHYLHSPWHPHPEGAPIPQCSPARTPLPIPSLWVTATTVVTKDIDDLRVPKHNMPKGDNHCLQLQHWGQDLSTETQSGSQGQLSSIRAKPSLLGS